MFAWTAAAAAMTPASPMQRIAIGRAVIAVGAIRTVRAIRALTLRRVLRILRLTAGDE